MADEASATLPAENNNEFAAGVRLVTLNLPEDEGEGLGFRLTRTLWDPYPWVREVTTASRADVAGLKAGDCILQSDGRDLLGLPVGHVAGMIRGDGSGRGVSLLVWSCGVDPQDDPELLWSCGGGVRGERARRAVGGVLRALACCVCSATVRRALVCGRSHLYCEGCWARLKTCALCRDPLPAKDSPYARNLVAEQVFEAIATEYEIKDSLRRPTETVSARTSPNVSPDVTRRGQYQLSLMHRTKKNVQFGDRFHHNYASDPNISHTLKRDSTKTNDDKSPNLGENSRAGNTDSCRNCQSCTCKGGGRGSDAFSRCVQNNNFNVPQIHVQSCEDVQRCCQTAPAYGLQHKLVARLRTTCSMADLKNATVQTCGLSRSLNSIDLGSCHKKETQNSSLDDIKSSCAGTCDNPQVVLLSSPPIYLLTCDHKTERNVS